MERTMTATLDRIPDGHEALSGAFLAGDYHGGMMTALYALSSTGSLELHPGEGPDRIRGELEDAIRIAATPEDADDLTAFLDWVIEHSTEADDDGDTHWHWH
jgi:hypothetical protein